MQICPTAFYFFYLWTHHSVNKLIFKYRSYLYLSWNLQIIYKFVQNNGENYGCKKITLQNGWEAKEK